MSPNSNYRVPSSGVSFRKKNQDKYSVISYNNKKEERETKKSKKRLKKLERQQERKQKGYDRC